MSRYSVIRLLETFFRRWWLYLIPLVLLCGLGAASLATKKHVYKSIATVEVPNSSILSKLTGADNGFGYDTPAVATSKQINSRLQTQLFMQDVAKRAGLTDLVTTGAITYDQMRASIGASESGSTLLKVIVNFEDPAVSQRLAQATIDAFVQSVLDANVADYTVAVAFLDDQLKTYQSDVDIARQALDDFLIAHPSPGLGLDRSDEDTIQIQRLQAAVSQAEQRYNTSVSKREDARLSTEQAKADVGRRIRVVDAPEVPTVPEGGLKTAVTGVAVFVMMGLVLSLAAVVVATTFDHSIRFPSDIRDRLGLAVLAVVPEAKAVRSLHRGRQRSKAPAPQEPQRARLAPRVNPVRSLAAPAPRERAIERDQTPAPRRPAAPVAPVAPAAARREATPAARQAPSTAPARKERPPAPVMDRPVERPAERSGANGVPGRREPEAVPPPAPMPAAVDHDENGRAWPPGRRPTPPSEPGQNGNGNGWPPSRRGGRSGNVPHAS